MEYTDIKCYMLSFIITIQVEDNFLYRIEPNNNNNYYYCQHYLLLSNLFILIRAQIFCINYIYLVWVWGNTNTICEYVAELKKKYNVTCCLCLYIFVNRKMFKVTSRDALYTYITYRKVKVHFRCGFLTDETGGFHL